LPNHRQLDPGSSASWGLPRLPPAALVAILGLLLSVVLAVSGAVLPGARIPLVVLAVAIAIPAATVALRRGRRAHHAPVHPGRGEATFGTAYIDRLTGAGNAAAWDASLAAAVDDPAASPLTIVRLAILPPVGDDGPSPDDPAGDDAIAGDEHLLVVAAVRWQEILRPGDRLTRLRSRDFAILLANCGGRESEAVLRRVLAAVPDGATCAVGVATWDGDEHPDELGARAEAALERQRLHFARDPFTDPDRLAAVRSTGLAVRSTQHEFDEVASSVAWLLAAPIVLITLFDDTWQHFLGTHGIRESGASLEGTPADEAMCRQTVATGRPLVVSDTGRHPALQRAKATLEHGIQACASVPITTAEGHVLGTVCAMVTERHPWSAEDVGLLTLTAQRVGERLAGAPISLTAA
jgi:hypothetical protein